MGKLVVCGVDGNFGGFAASVLRELVPADRIKVTAPTPDALAEYEAAGIETAVTNFNDPDGLAAAFQGADKVLVVSMPFVGPKRRAAHKNAVDACVAAGVRQVVYTSLVNATDPENPSIEKIDHAWTEAYIQGTDLDYVFLRNSQYAEAMVTAYFGSLEPGAMANNGGDGLMAFISRKDCARAAAHVLANPYLHHQVLNINGAEAMTMAQFCEYGNQATGNSIPFHELTDEQQYAVFDAMGVPRTTDGEFKDGSEAPFSSEGMVTFGEAIRLGKMAVCSLDYTVVTGRKPITVLEMFQDADNFQVGARHSVDA
ncbi:NAD(P)H-binding protein [Demequina zhanjiangensis]|uniref:NAD(P)H-binding protein n=1 Tax=Demequina zhanjiangensis TaxID=3051659 RepID=A0ABT8G3S7_9MICO|nr:NAD(P)H-binding protein [Demequina sp. SYSU T00b26]MDN4473727.1 NAD(P)H-binding protein [Demequina sp. SYSU T00b26]